MIYIKSFDDINIENHNSIDIAYGAALSMSSLVMTEDRKIYTINRRDEVFKQPIDSSDKILSTYYVNGILDSNGQLFTSGLSNGGALGIALNAN